MASVLNTAPDLESKAGSLVQAALDAGGKDNITIVIAEKNTTDYTHHR
jgi:serine/threonine protein phosphatase PrpC